MCSTSCKVAPPCWSWPGCGGSTSPGWWCWPPPSSPCWGWPWWPSGRSSPTSPPALPSSSLSPTGLATGSASSTRMTLSPASSPRSASSMCGCVMTTAIWSPIPPTWSCKNRSDDWRARSLSPRNRNEKRLLREPFSLGAQRSKKR